MLEKLNKLNPDYTIKDVTDPAFKTYGRIVKNNVDEAIAYAADMVTDAAYIPSSPELEAIPCLQELMLDVYGGLDTCAGLVKGNNQVLNGIEYHQCSETIVAVTDYVLIVGHIWDMDNNTYDSSLCEIFYVPKGTTVECYNTTLHYTPVALSDDGFRTICLLLKGTGDPITRRGILKKKNKWFIAHPENTAKVKDGDYPGLQGKMIKIEYK